MIQIRTVRQTIQLQGKLAPKLTIGSQPPQSIKLVSSGPPGPQGVRGETGLSGTALIPTILDGGNF